jgi:hypothetical protein
MISLQVHANAHVHIACNRVIKVACYYSQRRIESDNRGLWISVRRREISFLYCGRTTHSFTMAERVWRDAEHSASPPYCRSAEAVSPAALKLRYTDTCLASRSMTDNAADSAQPAFT